MLRTVILPFFAYELCYLYEAKQNYLDQIVNVNGVVNSKKRLSLFLSIGLL
jgi:hypothetical protein